MIWEVEDDDCTISSSPYFNSEAFIIMHSEPAFGVSEWSGHESKSSFWFTNIPARLASAAQLTCSWLMVFWRRFSACNYFVSETLMGSMSLSLFDGLNIILEYPAPLVGRF